MGAGTVTIAFSVSRDNVKHKGRAGHAGKDGQNVFAQVHLRHRFGVARADDHGWFDVFRDGRLGRARDVRTDAGRPDAGLPLRDFRRGGWAIL